MEDTDKEISFKERVFLNPALSFGIFITLLCIIGFILTNAIGFIVIGWISFILSAIDYTKRKKDTRVWFIAAGVLSILPTIYCSIFVLYPFLLPSGALWKYPFQKVYLDVYQNVKEPEWFPDFLRDVKSDYRFDYFPHVMQADGHYCVRFKTTPQTAEEYVKEFETQAEYILPIVDGYIDTSSLNLEEGETLTIHIDEDFWANCSSFTKAYVLFDNFYWNHPHSAAVIVDTATGKIQISQNS